MRISKENEEFSFKAELITPTLMWKNISQTIQKGTEKLYMLDIPIKFVLTNQENYFSIQISFIIGLKISLTILENQHE